MENINRPPLRPQDEIAATPVSGEPDTVWEQINKYGTYEVQDTTDTDNTFPTIGPPGSFHGCLESLPPIPPEKNTPAP